ncbi:MAG: UDP-N-acetylmuramoyl-tripeptide-D-alanyl-D-alanine ligase [Candidatus Roizmanbacteria bacterium GW2011_GWA2_35_8]|uniref:UDP-N-acetylmuramoyl-tripeptide-D-alanyl-D-alanine ligase n=1 Tax=Candidatus Roizmanbacteria bacterium GW2011_GWA2_35_8 TaxID=1618479 RepID=A0A0G0FHR3_9BACT|nr:MAG: UDP-N-acetylmuramoyl-tripeptide-D-alanyl-D-alanine ligase [Candidatus Roizmanbacteria bacterium GW2011_GWA2_35_8]
MFGKVYNLFVWGLLYYLRFFAWVALYLNRPKKIIGITGSVGKSSARNAIDAILRDHFKTMVVKQGNSETGVPLGILGINPGNYTFFDWLRIIFTCPFKIDNLKGSEYLIVEMGIDSPLPPKNMDYLLTIIKPDIAVILNVYPVHTAQFDVLFKEKKLAGVSKSRMILEKIIEEKMKLITLVRPKFAVYNENLASHNLAGYESFGTSNRANIKFINYIVNLKESQFEFQMKEGLEKVNITIKNYLLPVGYNEIFAASILVARKLGLTNEKIKSSLEKNFLLPASRGSLFKGLKSTLIIDSSYNASREAVINFIDLTSDLSKQEKRPLVFVLGDMRELGDEAREEHMKIVERIIEKKPNRVILTGPLTKKYILPVLKKRFRKTVKVKWLKTSILAGEFLKRHLPYRGIILFKGSQNEIFLEEAVKKILKNKEDFKKLCRQNDFWLNKKRRFFLGGVTSG